ncbi:hypothetical protein ACFO3A_03470 [Comamonas nitrativorans]|uniref:Uncharacterized protein n=1 Tax=Comamonas nitrativorans TaxID=108437 RepID=A0ABV9GSU3_9BURK
MRKSKFIHGSEITRSLVTISLGIALFALYFGWPKAEIRLPPKELASIIRVTLTSDPVVVKENGLLEVQGAEEGGKSGWWYFAPVESLVNNLRKDQVLDVLVSQSDDSAYGGRGYIWQVHDASEGRLLMSANQAAEYRSYENFTRYLKLCIGLLLSTIVGIAGYRNHLKVGGKMVDMAR